MQYQEGGSPLHPLLATSALHRNEDSMDTNADEHRPGGGQADYTRRVFGAWGQEAGRLPASGLGAAAPASCRAAPRGGVLAPLSSWSAGQMLPFKRMPPCFPPRAGAPGVDTQGPAGSRVPDLDDAEHQRQRRRRHPHHHMHRHPSDHPSSPGDGAGFGGVEDADEAPPFRYLEDTDAPPDAVGECTASRLALLAGASHMPCVPAEGAAAALALSACWQYEAAELGTDLAFPCVSCPSAALCAAANPHPCRPACPSGG